MKNEIITKRHEIENYDMEVSKDLYEKELEKKRMFNVMLDDFDMTYKKLDDLLNEGAMSKEMYQEYLEKLNTLYEKNAEEVLKMKEKKDKGKFSEKTNIEKEEKKILKDLKKNMDNINSSFKKAGEFAHETGELTMLKMEQTEKNIKSLELLEDVINNPNLKMSEIINNKNINYNGVELELLIAFTQFLINKDKAIYKNGKNYENLLLDVLITNKDNPDVVKNFTNNINVIRNAIGHGRYTIDPQNLDIIIDNEDKIFNYKDVKELIENYFVNNDDKINKLPFHTGFIANVEAKDLNINNFENQIDNFMMWDITIKNVKEDYDIEVLKEIQNKISRIKKDNISDLETINRIINGASMASKFAGLEIECINYKLANAKNNLKDNIMKIANENYDSLKNRDSFLLESFVKGCANDLYFDTKTSLQLDKALSQIRALAFYTHTDNDLTYNQVKETKKDLPPTDNQMLLATTLVKFNMLYSYNNETIFKKGLDFSKIDLSFLQPNINEDTDTTYKSYNEKVKGYYKSLDEEQIKYQNSLKHTPLFEERKKLHNLKVYGTMFMLLDNEYVFEKERFDYKENIVDKDKYIENKNILMHIRNSITHGNIVINKRIKNNDLSSCEITFNDYNGENKTFELTTTLDKIAALNNYRELFKMLDKQQIVNYTYPENAKVYSGFTNSFTFITIILIESIALLFYILLKTEII